MELETFRRSLIERQRTAVHVAAARMNGEEPDESRLAEIDGHLFSRTRAEEAAAGLAGARSSSERASWRSVLAFTLEEGLLARLRSLDRAIERACARGRVEEARELAEERIRRIADEASRPRLLLARPGESTERARTEKADEWPSAGGLSAAIALVRSSDLSRLVSEAREMLEGTAPLLEDLLASGFRPARAEARSGRGSGAGSTIDAAPSSLADRVDRLLSDRFGRSVVISPRSVAAAIAEIVSGLGFGDAPPFALREPSRSHAGEAASRSATAHPRGRGPAVLEEDPPHAVSMVLPDGDDASSLAGSLAASAEALTASLRSAALPPEHRLRADRSFALALGTLFASIAPEHALLRPMGIVARRRALAREVLASRLDAAATLSLARSLAQRSSTGDEDVLAQAALGPAPFPAIPSSREPLFEALDRFRGDLLTAPINDRLRTRFGNLWYRDRGAGRWIRDAAEPGGSVTASEIAAGLSLPEGGAAWLREIWLSEERRLR